MNGAAPNRALCTQSGPGSFERMSSLLWLLLFLLRLLAGRRIPRAVALGLALLGSLLQLLEFLRLFGARLAVAFRALLPVVRLECHGRSFPDRLRNQDQRSAASGFRFLIFDARQAYTRSSIMASAWASRPAGSNCGKER
jgi:hypothetical protein